MPAKRLRAGALVLLAGKPFCAPPPPEKAMAATARRVCMTAAIKEDFFVGHLLRKGPGSASSRGRQETGCLALPAGQLLAPPLPGRQWGFHSHHISGLTILTVATPFPFFLFIPCHLPSWCRIGGGGKLSTSNQRVVQQVKKRVRRSSSSATQLTVRDCVCIWGSVDPLEFDLVFCRRRCYLGCRKPCTPPWGKVELHWTGWVDHLKACRPHHQT